MNILTTTYQGVKMRSRTEARFAEWCDAHRVKWVYEPEGFYEAGVAYLPDFYLPEIRTIVEVKPLIFIEETCKMAALINNLAFSTTQFWVVTMEPELVFLRRWDAICSVQYLDEWLAEGYKYNRNEQPFHYDGSLYDHSDAKDTEIVWCKDCESPIIFQDCWRCRKCGAYRGNKHLRFES